MPQLAQGLTILLRGEKVSDYWEGYTERSEAETHEWVDYYRSTGQIVKIFLNISEFRSDCNRMLDKWDEERKRSKG